MLPYAITYNRYITKVYNSLVKAGNSSQLNNACDQMRLYTQTYHYSAYATKASGVSSIHLQSTIRTYSYSLIKTIGTV